MSELDFDRLAATFEEVVPAPRRVLTQEGKTPLVVLIDLHGTPWTEEDQRAVMCELEDRGLDQFRPVFCTPAEVAALGVRQRRIRRLTRLEVITTQHAMRSRRVALAAAGTFI